MSINPGQRFRASMLAAGILYSEARQDKEQLLRKVLEMMIDEIHVHGWARAYFDSYRRRFGFD